MPRSAENELSKIARQTRRSYGSATEPSPEAEADPSPSPAPSPARAFVLPPSRGAARPGAAPVAKPKLQAVMYARVSSKDQEKEGFSIPAQQKLLRGYAETNGFDIKEEFTDVETAKKAGRTSFGKMIAWLKKNKACRVILVEKTDRLYRNLRDWVEIDGMDVEIHLVKENVVLSETTRSHEKFIHGIKVLMAKNYIDNLSEEVKKGMLEKAEQGIFPGAATIGYLNVSRADGKRIIDLDPDRSAIVKRLFEVYATGRFSLKDLAKEAKALGLVSRQAKKPLAIPALHIMLHNPLYKGEYVWNGKWYQGTHPALITSDLWDRVQAIMAGRGTVHPAEQKNQFAFTGLVYCGICADEGLARLMIGEIQREKYIYYHCNHCQKENRKPKYIREEVLGAMFVPHLRRLHLDGPVLDWLKGALRESHLDEQRFHHEAIAKLQRQYTDLQRKIDTAYDDRLDGRLTLEAYERRANGWRAEMAHLRTELARHENADRAYTEEGIALLELSGMALDLYETNPAPVKRELLDFLCLNTEFRGDTLTVRFKKPFDILAESIDEVSKAGVAFSESGDARQEMLPLPDLNRGPSD